MTAGDKTASIILAAGRGSRMAGFEGNKTLLPLVPDKGPFQGSHPILFHILKNLPPGPRALVVHHKKEEIIDATSPLDLTYCEQPVLNGTGGGLLAARAFVERPDCDRLIITMGDVPFVKTATYDRLVESLESMALVVLGFIPADKKQYGVLEIQGAKVRSIIEWKYWRKYPPARQAEFQICNSGIYAVRKEELHSYLQVMEGRPHTVSKEKDGKLIEFQEFFITDLVELMDRDGREVGYALADDENEVMGIDDFPALEKAQQWFKIN